MRKDQDSMEERLEARLRSLPELDPPENLVLQVMAALDDVEAAESPSASRGSGVLLGQFVAAAFLLSVVVVGAGLRFLPAWVAFVGSAARFGAGVLQYAIESGVTFIATSGAALVKTGLFAAALWQAVGTAVGAVAAEYGSFLAALAVTGVALQVLWVTAMARRPHAD